MIEKVRIHNYHQPQLPFQTLLMMVLFIKQHLYTPMQPQFFTIITKNAIATLYIENNTDYIKYLNHSIQFTLYLN